MLKSVKLREETYRWLVGVAGELQRHQERPVSIDEALSFIRGQRGLGNVAGSWKMSDKEAALFLQKTRAEWKKWKPFVSTRTS